MTAITDLDFPTTDRAGRITDRAVPTTDRAGRITDRAVPDVQNANLDVPSSRRSVRNPSGAHAPLSHHDETAPGACRRVHEAFRALAEACTLLVADQ